MQQLRLFLLLFKHFKREIVMKKPTPLFVTQLFLLLNCTAFAQTFFDKNFTAKQTEHYADGKPKYAVNVKKGKKEGVETAWNKDGSVKYTSTYANGQQVKP